MTATATVTVNADTTAPADKTPAGRHTPMAATSTTPGGTDRPNPSNR